MGKSPYAHGTRDRLIERLRRQAIALHNGNRRPEVLLTTGEVAMLFRVSNRAVRCWADAGSLPTIRTIGGHRRFLAAAVWDALRDITDLKEVQEQPAAQVKSYDPAKHLTVVQITGLAGVDKTVVYSWRAKGQITPVGTARNERNIPILVFDRESIEDFLAKQNRVINLPPTAIDLTGIQQQASV